MRLAIVGNRDYHNYEMIKEKVDYIRGQMVITEIVSGGAPGVDALAKRYATENKLQYTEFPADWEKYGKAAGPLRNTQIVEYSDFVIAFPQGKSPGTRDTIAKAEKEGKLIMVYEL